MNFQQGKRNMCLVCWIKKDSGRILERDRHIPNIPVKEEGDSNLQNSRQRQTYTVTIK